MLVTAKAPRLSGIAVLGNGQIENNFDLYSNIGPKGAVVFFYPKDFTFVCPSEIIAFDNRFNEFKERGINVIGVMAFFLPVELICALIAWYLTGKIFKISSLASLCALIVFLASSFILHYDLEPINTHAPLFIICFIILAKHSTNIARLISGAEKKVI